MAQQTTNALGLLDNILVANATRQIYIACPPHLSIDVRPYFKYRI